MSAALPGGWRPIETAPVDREDVLLWTPSGMLVGYRYVRNKWHASGVKASDEGCDVELFEAPTHWMPLPADPAEPPVDAPALIEALQMARGMIATERQSFADCNVVPGLTDGDDPDNFVSIGGALFEQHDADVVADYDRALAQMDAAIARATGGAS